MKNFLDKNDHFDSFAFVKTNNNQLLTKNNMTALEFSTNLVGQQRFLEGYARQLTGNPDDAKDLTQETFLKALIHREKFVNQNNFKAWLYTIMKNIFINNYRRIKKENTIIDQTDDLYYLNISNSNSDTDPESMLNAKELENGINSLDADFRKPFDMYNDGFKYKEIADALNLTIGTVKSRIFYSRKKLMENMKEFGA